VERQAEQMELKDVEISRLLHLNKTLQQDVENYAKYASYDIRVCTGHHMISEYALGII